MHAIEGIADGFVPGIVDRHRSEICEFVSVSSDDGVAEMRRLAHESRHLRRPELGRAHGGREDACVASRPELQTVVTLFCDEGEKYIADHHGPR